LEFVLDWVEILPVTSELGLGLELFRGPDRSLQEDLVSVDNLPSLFEDGPGGVEVLEAPLPLEDGVEPVVQVHVVGDQSHSLEDGVQGTVGNVLPHLGLGDSYLQLLVGEEPAEPQEVHGQTDLHVVQGLVHLVDRLHLLDDLLLPQEQDGGEDSQLLLGELFRVDHEGLDVVGEVPVPEDQVVLLDPEHVPVVDETGIRVAGHHVEEVDHRVLIQSKVLLLFSLLLHSCLILLVTPFLRESLSQIYLLQSVLHRLDLGGTQVVGLGFQGEVVALFVIAHHDKGLLHIRLHQILEAVLILHQTHELVEGQTPVLALPLPLDRVDHPHQSVEGLEVQADLLGLVQQGKGLLHSLELILLVDHEHVLGTHPVIHAPLQLITGQGPGDGGVSAHRGEDHILMEDIAHVHEGVVHLGPPEVQGSVDDILLLAVVGVEWQHYLQGGIQQLLLINRSLSTLGDPPGNRAPPHEHPLEEIHRLHLHVLAPRHVAHQSLERELIFGNLPQLGHILEGRGELVLGQQ